MNLFQSITLLLISMGPFLPTTLPAQQRVVESAPPEEQITLNEVIRSALEHNHRIRIAAIESELATSRATPGNAGLLPDLYLGSEWTGSYGTLEMTPGSLFNNLIGSRAPDDPVNASSIRFDNVTTLGFTAGLGSRYILYDGGRGRLRLKNLNSAVEISDLYHLQEMENTVMEVIRAYIRAATLLEKFQIHEEFLQQSLDRVRRLEARHDYGQTDEQPFLQALADLKSDSTDYRELIVRYEDAWSDLHLVIGWPQSGVQPLMTELSPTKGVRDYGELLEALQDHKSALLIRRQQVEMAHSELELSRSRYLPSLIASARYGYTWQHASDGLFESQEQIGLSGGLTLRIPIFNGGQTKSGVEQARAELRYQELQREETALQLTRFLEKNWRNHLHLQERLETGQVNLPVYERNYRLSTESFRQGLIPGTELRSAQLSLLSARQRISELKLQLKLSDYSLLYLSGKLLQFDETIPTSR